MALTIAFQHRGTWPGTATPPYLRHSGNGMMKTPGDAMSSLRRELDRIRAKDVTLAVVVRSDKDIRVDGQLRADAKVVEPGVIVNWTHPKQGPCSMRCDRYKQWFHNVRAIALTLEALRGVTRWACIEEEAQYRAVLALPSTATITPPLQDAMAVLMAHAQVPAHTTHSTLEAKSLYRLARANAHPDRHGGDRTAWDAVEAAARTLGLV
jgi:hypothetical protein